MVAAAGARGRGGRRQRVGRPRGRAAAGRRAAPRSTDAAGDVRSSLHDAVLAKASAEAAASAAVAPKLIKKKKKRAAAAAAADDEPPPADKKAKAQAASAPEPPPAGALGGLIAYSGSSDSDP